MALRRILRKTPAHVTTAHIYEIPAHLLGQPLASVWRRSVAIAVDFVSAVVIATPILLLLALLAIRIQAPAAAEALRAAFSFTTSDDNTSTPEEGTAQNEQLASDWEIELLQLVAKRRPDLLSEDITLALASNDRAAFARATEGLSLQFDLGAEPDSRFDASSNTLNLRRDVLYGPFASTFSYFVLVLAYFTLLTRIGRGWTLGKWLAGIRVVRLDGKAWTLWSSFGRAGGYGASLSTFGLGFLQALWNRNRQALHDRIAETVVVRAQRLGRHRRRTAPENETAKRKESDTEVPEGA